MFARFGKAPAVFLKNFIETVEKLWTHFDKIYEIL